MGLTRASMNGQGCLGRLLLAKYQGKMIGHSSSVPIPHLSGLGRRFSSASKSTQTEQRICTPPSTSWAFRGAMRRWTRVAPTTQIANTIRKIRQEKRTGAGSCPAGCATTERTRGRRISAGSIACLQATQTRHEGANNCPQAGQGKGSLGNRSSAGRVSLGALAFSNGLSFSVMQVLECQHGQNVPVAPKPFRPRSDGTTQARKSCPNKSRLCHCFSFHPSWSFQSKICQWTSARGNCSNVRSCPSAWLPLCD